MTIRELIAALSEIEDQDREVLLDGCDCMDVCGAIDPDFFAPQVLLVRADHL